MAEEIETKEESSLLSPKDKEVMASAAAFTSVLKSRYLHVYMYMYRYCVVLPAGILLACLLSFKLLCVQVALMIVFGGQFS